jgi:hypothetical protein
MRRRTQLMEWFELKSYAKNVEDISVTFLKMDQRRWEAYDIVLTLSL